MGKDVLIATLIFLLVLIVVVGVIVVAFGGDFGSTNSVKKSSSDLELENQALKNKIASLESNNLQFLSQINSNQKKSNTNTYNDPYYDLEILRRAYDDDECDDLEDEEDDIEDDIKDIEDEIEELEDEISDKKSKGEDTKDLEEELDELEEELDKLEEDLEDNEDEQDDEDC